ncbi:MAG: hypothetical protein WC359_13175 [Dehalococcoidia bacterium]
MTPAQQRDILAAIEDDREVDTLDDFADAEYSDLDVPISAESLRILREDIAEYRSNPVSIYLGSFAVDE